METFDKLFDYKNIDKFEENIKISLRNIKKLNCKLNAFCRVYDDEVRNGYETVKNKINNRSAKKLSGIIVGIKDLICYKNHKIQAASKILDGFIPSYNAHVVDKILENDGLIIGHQNCDEFGMGSSNTNSIYGAAHNYLDYFKTPGGSSGGSAVAIQTDMCHVSIGTDTGGSIRQPASYCGIIGFKPSYGRISRYGIISHASSFDTVSLLSKKINYIEDVFKIISEHDEKDLSMCFEKYESEIYKEEKNYKIAFLLETLKLECLQKEIGKKICDVLEKLKIDNVVESTDFEYIEYASSVYFILTTIEASSNLARYDGLNYGYRSKNYNNYEEMITNTRSEGFGLEVKKRLLLANFLFKSNKETKYIEKAQSLREKYKHNFDEIFKTYDFIILPTTTTTAFKIEEKIACENSNWDNIYTTIASLAGLPAISIPCGIDGNKMPFGLQIIGRKNKENELFNFVRMLKNKEIINNEI